MEKNKRFLNFLGEAVTDLVKILFFVTVATLMMDIRFKNKGLCIGHKKINDISYFCDFFVRPDAVVSHLPESDFETHENTKTEKETIDGAVRI